MSSSKLNCDKEADSSAILEQEEDSILPLDDQTERVLQLVLDDSTHDDEQRGGLDAAANERTIRPSSDSAGSKVTEEEDGASGTTKKREKEQDPAMTKQRKEDMGTLTTLSTHSCASEQKIPSSRAHVLRSTTPALNEKLATASLTYDDDEYDEEEHPVVAKELSPSSSNTAAPPTSRPGSNELGFESEPGAYASRPTSDDPSSDPQQSDGVGIMVGDEQRPQAEESDQSSSYSYSYSYSAQPQTTTLIEAVEVVQDDRAQLEAHIRHSILQEAVQASVLQETTARKHTLSNKKICICGGVLLLLGAILGLGLGLGLTQESKHGEHWHPNLTEEQTDATAVASSDSALLLDRPTLEVVKERGFVQCGVNHFAFSKYIDETEEEMEGFNIEQCKAMALMALGDANAYQTVWASPSERFQLLANHSIDILIQGTTLTLGRDVFEVRGPSGFTFTQPYFYSGLLFSGVSDYVECAQELDDFHGVCRDLQICVADGSNHLDTLNEILRGSVIVPSKGGNKMISNLIEGTCNVIASEPMFSVKVRKHYPSEDFQMGQKIFSKEPLSLVTRQDDPEWSTLASLTVDAFLIAEAQNITKDNAQELALLVDDENLASILVDLISEFGHHGNLYHTYIEGQIPRGNGLNTVYGQSDTSGLLYALPFGNIKEIGPDPIVNGTLETILKRGHLLCGILPNQRGPGFASQSPSNNNGTWTGLDTNFCRALAASLFAGDQTKVEFVPLEDSKGEFYAAVAHHEVDVVAGARVTLQAMYKEPTTNQGYIFSSPYYYDNDTKDGFGFLTRQHDAQWSDFVFWIVHGLIFAEEEGITSTNSTKMPVVASFGQDLKQMQRDCVASVGNYADVYNQSLGFILPRTGANRLNEGLAGPQLYPVPLK